MSSIYPIPTTVQPEIALAEQAAKDLIAVANALTGLLGLRQGGAIVGMPATQYHDALQVLLGSVAAIGDTR